SGMRRWRWGALEAGAGRKRLGRLLLAAAVGSLSTLTQPPLAVRAADCLSETQLVSIADDGGPANERSVVPAINAAGTVVAFKSYATNLIMNDRNDKVDVFVRDQSSQATERVTVAVPAGTQPNDNSYPPALDASGHVVTFGSMSSNLVFDDFNHSPDL